MFLAVNNYAEIQNVRNEKLAWRAHAQHAKKFFIYGAPVRLEPTTKGL